MVSPGKSILATKTSTISLFLIAGLIYFGAGCNQPGQSPAFPAELGEVSVPEEGVLPFFKGESMDPYWPESEEKYPADLRRLHNFQLVAHDSSPFDSSRLEGRYTLISFFFVRCSGICPMITSNLRKLSQRIPRQSDLQWLSITINPDEDDVAALDQYRRNHSIVQSNWFFLTGPRAAIYQLARQQFGADVQTVNGRDSLTDFVHTENVYLLDRKGYLRGAYRARGMGDLGRLLKDLELLRERDRNIGEAE